MVTAVRVCHILFGYILTSILGYNEELLIRPQRFAVRGCPLAYKTFNARLRCTQCGNIICLALIAKQSTFIHEPWPTREKRTSCNSASKRLKRSLPLSLRRWSHTRLHIHRIHLRLRKLQVLACKMVTVEAKRPVEV